MRAVRGVADRAVSAPDERAVRGVACVPARAEAGGSLCNISTRAEPSCCGLKTGTRLTRLGFSGGSACAPNSAFKAASTAATVIARANACSAALRASSGEISGVTSGGLSACSKWPCVVTGVISGVTSGGLGACLKWLSSEAGRVGVRPLLLPLLLVASVRWQPSPGHGVMCHRRGDHGGSDNAGLVRTSAAPQPRGRRCASLESDRLVRRTSSLCTISFAIGFGAKACGRVGTSWMGRTGSDARCACLKGRDRMKERKSLPEAFSRTSMASLLNGALVRQSFGTEPGETVSQSLTLS